MIARLHLRPLALGPWIVLAAVAVVELGCDRSTQTEYPTQADGDEPTGHGDGAEAQAAACVPRDGLMATVYNATAAEYRASTLQAYAVAQVALDAALADGMRTAAPEQEGDVRDLPPAVILDVDETVLDNSPYQAWLAQEGRRFEPETWSAWVEARKAKAVPGAREFTLYAASKGVTVFYVTNRDVSGEAATHDNLKAQGFPMGDGETDVLLLKNERPEWGSAKGTRRAEVAAKYRVVMLVGDNLGDFTDQSEGSIDQRGAIVEHHGDRWGTRWVMIPNPMYGGWEKAAIAGAAADTPEARQRALLVPAMRWSGPG